MLRFLRIALAVVGTLLVVGSSALSWVDVDVDTEAIADASESAVDGIAGEDSHASDLVEGARDTIERADAIIPDRLLDASLNGLNAYELAGVGFVVASLAAIALLAAVIWGVWGIGWVRWIGLVIAFLNVLLIPAIVVVVVAGRALLNRLLPESWEVYSPTFDITAKPLITFVGATLIIVSLLGRSHQRDHGQVAASASVAPPPKPAFWS